MEIHASGSNSLPIIWRNGYEINFGIWPKGAM